MNPERRLDRLERVLKLAIRAGYRERLAWREQSREQTEKINMIIQAHMDTTDRLDKQLAAGQKTFNDGLVASRAEFDERMGKLAASQVKFERRMNKLAAAQEKFDEGLAASRVEFDERMNKLAASHARFDEHLAASRVEFNEQLAASRAEFDERMAAFDERMDKLLIAQDKSDKKIDKLAEEHAATERSLRAFLDGLRKNRNGKTST